LIAGDSLLVGATDVSKVHVIDIEKLPDDFRLQRLTFRAARKAFEDLSVRFKGNREYLVVQLIRLIEEFLGSDKLVIPSLFHQEPLRKRILLALNIDLIVQHLLRYVGEQNLEHIEPVFDEERPIGSTRDISLERRKAALRSRLPGAAGEREDADPRDEEPGLGSRTCEALGARRVGAGREHEGRVRRLVPGRRVRAGAGQRLLGAAFGLVRGKSSITMSACSLMPSRIPCPSVIRTS
jgi:hypothetical protein